MFVEQMSCDLIITGRGPLAAPHRTSVQHGGCVETKLEQYTEKNLNQSIFLNLDLLSPWGPVLIASVINSTAINLIEAEM